MRYYKYISDDGLYIVSIGTGYGVEITEAEYNTIMSVIQNRPHADGKGYKLRTDLTWEEYDLPPEPEPSDDDELTDEEALSILYGGAV